MSGGKALLKNHRITEENASTVSILTSLFCHYLCFKRKKKKPKTVLLVCYTKSIILTAISNLCNSSGDCDNLPIACFNFFTEEMEAGVQSLKKGTQIIT